MKCGKTLVIDIDADGLEYVKQAVDEMDKTHGPDDNFPSNDRRMYSDPGT